MFTVSNMHLFKGHKSLELPHKASYLATFSNFILEYSFRTGLPTSDDSMVLLSIYVNWSII